VSRDVKSRIDHILQDYRPDFVYMHNIGNPKTIRYISSKCPTVRYVHDHKTTDPDGKMLLHDPLEVNKYRLSPACFLRAYTRRSMPRHPAKGVKAYLRATGLLKATKDLEHILVSSSYMKNVLMVNGVEEGKIAILPYFAHPPENQGYEDADECLYGQRSGDRILFAGRIAEGKGLDVLIEVLGMLAGEVFLDVAGTGPQEDLVKQKVRKMGLDDRVVFHGWKSHEALAELYRTCGLLVVPSVWPEPFGICGIEAAFFGKPAVAFDVGGISDWLIDGETGFLVEPYDKNKMAERISFLLSDNVSRVRMGERAKELAFEKYSPEKHVERLLAIFERAIANNRYAIGR
jgi:glycosyltransferase involved in cell wall biosynthesis